AGGPPGGAAAGSGEDRGARAWGDSGRRPYAGARPRPLPRGDEGDAPRPPAPPPIRARTDDGPAGIRRPDEAPGVSRPDEAPGVSRPDETPVGNRPAEAVTPKRWEDPGAQDGPKPQRTRDADETKPERDLPLVGPPPPPPPPSPPGRPDPSAKED